MDGQSDSIVLEEEIDPNYEPTEKEVLEYATWLGMDLEGERDLFWIAREGLKAPLPENWKPCKTTDTEEIYYFNFASGQSTWDHPCDEFYRNLYDEHKKKRQTNDVQQETDEKKKKAKEDVAELLGRKTAKKKKGSLAKAEPLGGPSLGKTNALEKKPLPGLSGRLGSLGSSGLSGGLKPVSGLGPLKSEAKDLGGCGVGMESSDDFKADDTPKPLSRGPLSNVLGKKPLLSSPSTSSVAMGETKSNAVVISDFEEKRERLVREHAEKLREIQDAHAVELEATRKKLKAQMEDVQDAEEMKLKHLKRELDKKRNDLENQFDREENTLQRNRKDQLKRLETEIETAFNHKKQDLDCEFKSEVEKLQLKNEAKQREIREDYDQQVEKLAEKMKAMLGEKKEAAQLATELKEEVERLMDQHKTLNQELSELRSENDSLRQDKDATVKERDRAHRDIEELRKQFLEARSSESSTVISQECVQCPMLADQVSSLQTDCNDSKGKLEKLQNELVVLKRELEAQIAAEAKKDNELTSFRDQDVILKQEIAALKQKLASLEAELSAQQFVVQLDTGATDQTPFSTATGESKQLETLQNQLLSAQSEVASTKSELSDLQEQYAVIQTTNAQIKEHLMKELNEGKLLREQLDQKTEEVTQLAAEMVKCQEQFQDLQQQLESEVKARREKENACDALQKDIHDLEQAKDKVESKLSELESERLRLVSEVLSGMKEQLAKESNDKQVLREQLNAKADEAVQHLTSAADKHQRQMMSLQQQLENESRSRREQEETCGALRKEINTLEQSKRKGDSELAQLESEKRRLESEKAILTLRLDEIGTSSDQQSNRDCSKCTALRLDNDQLQLNARAGDDEQVETLQKQLSSAQAEVGIAKNELNELQEQHAAIQTTNAQIKEHLMKELNEGKLLREQLDQKTEEVTQLAAEMVKCQEQFQDLRQQLESEVKARREKENACDALQKDIHDLEQAKDKVESKLSELESERLCLESEVLGGMKEQLAKESNDKQVLREQLNAKADEAVQHLTSAADKHQRQMMSLQQQLENESRSRREQEETCGALRKEINTLEQSKRKGDSELAQLESEKRRLESEKAILTLRLDEMSMSRKRDEKSVVSVEEALADKKLEAEQFRANLKVAETDKEHLETRLKAQTQDFEQLLAKTHRLEAEYESERARCRTIERERDTALQRQQNLVDELETCQRKSRTLSTEISELQSLLSKSKASEQVSSSKVEQVNQKLRQLEQQKERDDFAVKMKLQQAEVELENVIHAKERAEMQLQAKEKELVSAKDEITRKESELESLQIRVKSLLSDKEEVQAALLNANMANAASASANRESAKTISASTDVMLVKLQLADANRNELELHLADISSQLENATRRCASLEARCRDQSVEIEALHVEVASLRSASQKMHMSALESLTLVERLEYEHKKRTLRSDFLNQLRDFQEREEQVLVRHKARLRAQYERHLEDLVAELEKIRQQRVEQEEALSAQVIGQIRQERDVKRTEAKRQVREELKQFEQDLHERKERDIAIISKAIEKEEDELGARLREMRQVAREEELSNQRKLPSHDGELESSRGRQLFNRQNTLRSRPESLDENDGDGFPADTTRKRAKSSNQLQKCKNMKRPDHQKRSGKPYRKWKQRLQEEVDLLVNARTLVANQRQVLTNQAHQLKASKNEWKRNSRSSQAHPIQREVKRMLEENMANWTEGMRKLRKQEAWIKHREQKLAKMKRTVDRLKQRPNGCDNNLSSRSEGSSDEDEEETRAAWSDYSNESELASTLEKLERLEEELASNTGGFSDPFSHDADEAVYSLPPQSYALQREPVYRYPLASSSGLFAPRRAVFSAVDPTGHDMRWMRSQRTAFGLRGDRFGATSVPSSGNRTEQVYHHNISRWARGREKVQHAATSHATWLSGLCEELREYGAKYTRVEGDTAEFVSEEDAEAS